MQRMALLIGTAPDRIAESGIRNSRIFLRKPENLLFGDWAYRGGDFEEDMCAITADPETQRLWALGLTCHRTLPSSRDGEHGAQLEDVFHTD